jgi:glycosyltransferase involved in cell wall biosynthesis
MKIALFHNMPSGGAKRHTFEQVRELVKRGHELVEYAPSTADQEYASFAPFVTSQHIYPFTGWQGGYHLPLISPYLNAIAGARILDNLTSLSRQIAAEIDQSGFDLALVKDCQVIFNPYVLRFLKTPSLFQCHHGLRNRLKSSTPKPDTLRAQIASIVYHPPKKLFDHRVVQDETRNIQSARRVITNSRHVVSLIRQVYSIQAFEIYPGINTDLFRPLDLPREDYVLSVGSLTYNKGYRFLIHALGQIPEGRRPRLLIASNSVDPEEQRIVETLARKEKVRLSIEVIHNDQHLVQVYNQAALMVYTPIDEALGLTPLEAMACATPVLGVAEGGVKETVPDGLTGYLLPRDVNQFAAKIDELLRQPRELLRLGSNGPAYIHEKWTWQRAVDKLEEHMRLTIGKER